MRHPRVVLIALVVAATVLVTVGAQAVTLEWFRLPGLQCVQSEWLTSYPNVAYVNEEIVNHAPVQTWVRCPITRTASGGVNLDQVEVVVEDVHVGPYVSCYANTCEPDGSPCNYTSTASTSGPGTGAFIPLYLSSMFSLGPGSILCSLPAGSNSLTPGTNAGVRNYHWAHGW